jgi:hypothetical protein
LAEGLIANAMISGAIQLKSKLLDGSIISSKQYRLQGISKWLLFSEINNKLKDKYGDEMPLLYSEPIILIDPTHQDTIIESLTTV